MQNGAEAKQVQYIGYVRQGAQGEGYLLVRQLAIHPSGNYRDVPANDPEDFGHCIQCYNDDGQCGNFGELEYHTPAIAGDGAALCDISQTWCYSGSDETIAQIAEALLGV